MELKFTGRGAMLYPVEGNTAAYFEEGDNFFLIDCGEDVSSKLIADGKLRKDKDYYLFITHTHSDHIGGLGTLQQYLYWVCGKKLNIVYDENVKYLEEIEKIITGFGIEEGTYNLIKTSALDHKFDSFDQIRYVESNHGPVTFKTASIIIKTKDGNILYTGDIADSKVIEYFMESSAGFIDKMYIDSSYTDSPVHLSIDKLNTVIPEELKPKVYCMHINSSLILPIIQKYGFNLVSVASGNIISRDVTTMTDEELALCEEKLTSKLKLVKSLQKKEHKSE